MSHIQLTPLQHPIPWKSKNLIFPLLIVMNEMLLYNVWADISSYHENCFSEQQSSRLQDQSLFDEVELRPGTVTDIENDIFGKANQILNGDLQNSFQDLQEPDLIAAEQNVVPIFVPQPAIPVWYPKSI